MKIPKNSYKNNGLAVLRGILKIFLFDKTIIAARIYYKNDVKNVLIW
jgi:hypothetical protein